MRLIGKITILLLIHKLRLTTSFKLDKKTVLDYIEDKYNTSDKTYSEIEVCKITSDLLSYIDYSKTEFPKFELYTSNLTANCEGKNYKETDNYDTDNQGLCYGYKLNENALPCCVGIFEDSMLTFISEFECLISSVRSGNATLEIFGNQENNIINKRMMDIMNVTLNNTLNGHNLTDMFDDPKIIESYEESLELLRLIKNQINKVVEMFLFERELFETQVGFAKYLVSIFCGLCSENVKQMILNTGNVNIIQMNQGLFESTRGVIMKNYQKLFEMLGILSIIIIKSKQKIEGIIDLHSEWITNILYNQIKNSSYDMNGLLDSRKNLVDDMFEKRSHNSRGNRINDIKDHNKITNYVGIISMNSMKQEINSIVRNSYNNSEWINNILHCIKDIPIYSEYSESKDYLKIDNKKYETYVTASISDPSGHTFISNFILIPLECIKMVVNNILKIIPNPKNDLVAYTKLLNSEIINTSEIAKQVISIFRNGTLGEFSKNEIVNNNLFITDNDKLTHSNEIKNYNKNNNKYLLSNFENIESYKDNQMDDNFSNITNKNSFVIISNTEAPDISQFSRSPPYSDNIREYVNPMKSCYFDINMSLFLMVNLNIYIYLIFIF